VQSTDIEEGLNKYSRQCLYVSNHKMGATNIIQMVIFYLTWCRSHYLQTAKRRGIVNQKFDSDKLDEQKMLADWLPWSSSLPSPKPPPPNFIPTLPNESDEISEDVKRDIEQLLSRHELDKAISYCAYNAFTPKDVEIECDELISYYVSNNLRT